MADPPADSRPDGEHHDGKPRLPGKAREWHNHHFDSTIRNDFRFRDDDIVVATYAKSGTTWARRIVAQTHPRIIKIHLPVAARVYSPQAKYA